MSKISRRDFLKLTSLLSGALTLSEWSGKLAPSALGPDDAPPSVLFFVFDTMSAKNLSLYGYQRKTTPNLEDFAARASVYHTHYAAGNFTTPGTASLLTGTYPWTHRAINESGFVARGLAGHNLFQALGQPYQRTAFSQNVWANYLLSQFRSDMDVLLPAGVFSKVDQLIGPRLGKDWAGGYRAFDDFLFQDGTPPASLVFGLAARVMLRRQVARAQDENYPVSIPRAGMYSSFFELRDVFDGLIARIQALTPPFFSYFHLWPPHSPYRPTREFAGVFNDNYRPIKKPDHVLGDRDPQSKMNDRRRSYDEYVACLDAEIARLIGFLAEQGILDRHYVIITSDHGESFERGAQGHVNPLLYDPLTRVPLLISSPGQTARRDIYSPTSAVDLVPTLLHLANREIPDWCEGALLPGFGGREDPGRGIFSVEAKKNPAFAPLSIATVAMRKGRYKLIYYTGYKEYEGRDMFELYDLENDPEELQDLYPADPPIASTLREELLAKFQGANSKYH